MNGPKIDGPIETYGKINLDAMSDYLSLNDLPNEILVPIINDLSTPDLLSLRQTCKTLWNLTHDAVFWSKRVRPNYPRKLLCREKFSTWQQEDRHRRLCRSVFGNGDWTQYHRVRDYYCHLNQSLIQAARTGPVELVRCLIMRGANQLKPALYAACEAGHLEIVMTLMTDAKFNLDDCLKPAAFNGHVKIVKYLLDHGARRLERALYFAVKFIYGIYHDATRTQYLTGTNGADRLELVRYLINRGATNFDQALDYAAAAGDLKLVQWIVGRQIHPTIRTLWEAIRSGHHNVIEWILPRIQDDWKMNSGLVDAARWGHLGLVQYFIAQGATEYHHAIMSAKQNNHVEVVNYLQRPHGINISVLTTDSPAEPIEPSMCHDGFIPSDYLWVPRINHYLLETSLSRPFGFN
jgi:ankyrin repeat protein